MMKRIFAAMTGLLALWATQAVAQPVTYYIQSDPYDAVSNYTACPNGGCSTQYDTSQRLSGSITFVSPLDPDMVDADVDVRIDSFNLSDGQNIITDARLYVDVFIQSARISTDSAGALTAFEFKFDRTGAPLGQPQPVLDNNDPGARVSSMWFSSAPSPGMAVVDTNSICQARGDNVGGNTLGAGCMMQWPTNSEGASSATATGVTMSLTPPPSPATVPTLTEWAMILLGLALACMAIAAIQRRRLA